MTEARRFLAEKTRMKSKVTEQRIKGEDGVMLTPF